MLAKRDYKKIIIFVIFMTAIIFIQNSDNAYASNFELRYKLEPPLPREYDISTTHELYLPEFNVKGIYVTGWAAGSPKIMNNLVRLTKNTVINSMVIDIKDQNGLLSYNSEIDFAREIGSNQRKIKDAKKLIQTLKDDDIYLIARLVLFKDKRLAQQRKDFALRLWDSNKKKEVISKEWVDPSQKKVWEYNIELAKEAVKLGFNEIQFDYIRYPALASKPLSVRLKEGTTKGDHIEGFIEYAHKELADFNVPISIDVFGLTTAANDDMGIGQNFKDLSKIVNIISPMVYPSHYASGSYGIKVPDTEPYKIIYNSLSDGYQKIQDKDNVTIRPWLQDFSLQYKYSLSDVVDQIKAAESLGIKEWLLWNPGSKYTEEALLYHLYD